MFGILRSKVGIVGGGGSGGGFIAFFITPKSSQHLAHL
tara:strand:+ start:204 stop:317 length:114 start_codon:yes stop_codon:yes gene_type:complete